MPWTSNCRIRLLFYFQSFHTSFVEFHVLVFTTKVYKYWIATWYLMPSECAPIQKINHIESSFLGLCKAVRNAIADSPTGRSLQSLYMAPAYICWVQIFALLFNPFNFKIFHTNYSQQKPFFIVYRSNSNSKIIFRNFAFWKLSILNCSCQVSIWIHI